MDGIEEESDIVAFHNPPEVVENRHTLPKAKQESDPQAFTPLKFDALSNQLRPNMKSN